MNLDELELALKTLIPLAGAASDLAARIFAGSVALSQARAELKGILSVASTRLDAADKVFAERDAAELARVTALPPIETK